MKINALAYTSTGEWTHNLLLQMELHARGARIHNRLPPMEYHYYNITCKLIN